MQTAQPIVRILVLAAAIGTVVIVPGCGNGGIFSRDGALGDSVEISMLAPFQGQWQFDEEKTFDAMRADGVPDEVIAQTRAAYEEIRKKFRSDEKAMAQIRASVSTPAVLERCTPTSCSSNTWCECKAPMRWGAKSGCTPCTSTAKPFAARPGITKIRTIQAT